MTFKRYVHHANANGIMDHHDMDDDQDKERCTCISNFREIDASKDPASFGVRGVRRLSLRSPFWLGPG